jgi:hypothetical protein
MMADRNRTKLLIDIVILVLTVALVATGVLLLVVLPPGGGLSLWGISRHGWGALHQGVGAVFVGLVLLHLGMNWTWMFVSSRKLVRDKAKPPSQAVLWLAALIALVVLVALVAGFIVAAKMSVVTNRPVPASLSGG